MFGNRNLLLSHLSIICAAMRSASLK